MRTANLLKVSFGLLMFSSVTALATPPAEAGVAPSEASDPYACRHREDSKSLTELRAHNTQLEGNPAITLAEFSGPDAACKLLEAAERYKRLGDARAPELYERAIKASADPAYSLFYADYLRNSRGASKPLYYAADRQYRDASAKLDQVSPQQISVCRKDAAQRANGVCTYDRIDADIKRGLSYLHARDGQPLIDGNASADTGRPQIYVSTKNQLGYTTSDFDRSDDARAFTSEALFSEGASRLDRSLSLTELKSIARGRYTFETTDRLTLRYDNLPSLDLFYHGSRADRAQITNFYVPAGTNDIYVDEYGAYLEQTADIGQNIDAALGVGYSYVDRKGLVEFLPNAHERIQQIKSNLALSTFWKATKVTLDTVYVRQFITIPLSPGYRRDRSIYGSSLTFYDPSERHYPLYGTKGVEYVVGYAHDIETYGTVDVSKDDFYVGASLYAIQPFGEGDNSPLFDVSIRPSLLTSSVIHDKSQTIWEYRTDARIAWRIVDQDRDRPSLDTIETDTVMLGVPFRHDVAVRGPSYYDNYRTGVDVDAVFAIHALGGTKLLASAGYNYQSFYKIGKSLNLFNVQISAGY